MKTLIIAEAGVNHNGSIEIAKKMIEIASKSGADFIKFQSFNPDLLALKTAPKANYQKLSGDKTESQYSMLKKLELSKTDHKILFNYCKKFQIGFLSTAFDINNLQALIELGQNIIKIPSGEITNLPLLECIGKLNKPTLLSTGMSTIGEIEAAMSVLEIAGLSRKKITLLHCTSEYPTNVSDVNLLAMQTIGATFGVKFGYSDHTLGIEIPIAAVALGAGIIEKHFTLSRDMEGPDHSASLEPHELNEMVRAIRNIEAALGDGLKRPTANELKNSKSIRKSIVAIKKIKKGEHFSIDNIGAKRPGTGLSPMKWNDLIGKKSAKFYDVDELINYD